MCFFFTKNPNLKKILFGGVCVCVCVGGGGARVREFVY